MLVMVVLVVMLVLGMYLETFSAGGSVKLTPAAHADKVDEQAGYHGDSEQDEENPPRLFREHGEHYKSFVATGCNHHCNQGAEADHSVSIKGDRCEPAHAARDASQERR